MNPLADLSIWDVTPPTVKEACCLGVEDQVQGLSFLGLQVNHLGRFKHEIGLFDYQGSPMLLIPGGVASLGYDTRTSTFITDALREEWHARYVEHDGWPSLDEELDRCMTPARMAVLEPFLIDARPRVPKVANPYYPDHPEVVGLLAGTPWRLPTRDEWEYTHRGGSPAFFPWGDELWPGYIAPANAFGFSFPSSSYHWEFVMTPGIMVGGDGGVAQCGGWGGLVQPMVRACGYFSDVTMMDTTRGHYRRCRSVLP